MNQNQQVCLTGINFPNGTVVTSTAQWIASIFNVLHPSQQEAVLEHIKGIAEAQQQRPLITIPGVQGESGL